MANGKKYCLTMTTEQAKLVRRSVELYMRLKLGQYEEIQLALMDVTDDDFCKRRDEAKTHLRQAFEAIYKGLIHKDREWYMLYNILQVIRHVIQQEEAPNSKGVDSYPPMDFDGVGMPGIEVVTE